MWADVDTDKDFLNYSEVAELTVDLIKDASMRPLSVGIFGTWGTGKSTLLNLIERELVPNNADDGPYLIVRFDAWLYQGYDDARAALMEVIGGRLMQAAAKQDANGPLISKARRFLGRVNYFRTIGLLAEGGAAALGFPTFGVISKGIGAVGDILSGQPTAGEIADAKAAGNELINKGKGLLSPEERRTPPEEIAAFRHELGELLQGLNKTLVVFVDNLDRCLPKQAIQTLEALRLFLFMSSTAFVIAADEDMIKHSVTSYFEDLDDRHVMDYLDKLIQVPVRVPRLGVQEVRAYMFLLFAAIGGATPVEFERLRKVLETSLRQAWKDEPISRQAALKLLSDAPTEETTRGFEIADRLAPLLAKSTSVQGNPRVVKRLLNVVRMRSRLAQRRKMPLDEPLIAKLALFERCTDSLATSELYRNIQESAGGKPGLIVSLEAIQDDEADTFRDALPDVWKGRHEEFIRDWISLEPKLSGVDLRPALYLSRETQPLKVRTGELSGPASDALRILLKTTNTISPSAKKAISLVAPSEHARLMDMIIDEFRKHGDWKTRPAGFEGAYILAEASPDAGVNFGTYIKSIFPDGKPPPWLKLQLKTVGWYPPAGAH